MVRAILTGAGDLLYPLPRLPGRPGSSDVELGCVLAVIASFCLA